MNNPTDRLSGLFFVMLGLTLFFYLIPTHVETVDYGAIRPKTMPQILAVIIGVFGAVLMVRPADGSDLQQAPWLKSGGIACILAVGLWLISRFGFEFIAAPMALVLMMVMGEKRPLWLGLGVVAMPTLIWLIVTILLERPLP